MRAKGSGQNKLCTRAPLHPRQRRCSSDCRNCSRQLCDTPAVHGGRIQRSILLPRALTGAALQLPRCCILYFDPGLTALGGNIDRSIFFFRNVNQQTKLSPLSRFGQCRSSPQPPRLLPVPRQSNVESQPPHRADVAPTHRANRRNH